MYAIHINSSDQTLLWKETQLAEPSENEVLLKIHATAVNRADLLQRQGRYPPPAGASAIPGLEAAGVIVKKGKSVTGFSIGEKVCCLLVAGGYAEYVCVPSQHLMHIPDHLSFEQAAAIPEAYLTAYLNLYLEANLKKNEKVLIHAAASGVGIAAVQLASILGSSVYATCGTIEKCEFVKSQGAYECINYKSQDLIPSFEESSMDVVLDMVGQLHFEKNLRILRHRGRLIMLSVISGSKSGIDLSALLRKNLTIKGSTLRARSIAEKAALIELFRHNVLPLFQPERITPIVCKVFRIEDAQQAHAYVEADLNLGKVVLKVI